MKFDKSKIGASTNGLPATRKDEQGRNKVIKSYDVWQSMINRCYSKTYQEKNPTYIGCFVSEHWLNYKNFKKWFDDNYINGYQLDKDLSHPNNKEYSQDKCRFVHPHINSLLSDHKRKRGSLPQGVTAHRYGYQARLNKKGVNVNLGSFKDPTEAFNKYKKEKESYVKEVAKCHFDKGALDQLTYDYLMQWTVEQP